MRPLRRIVLRRTRAVNEIATLIMTDRFFVTVIAIVRDHRNGSTSGNMRNPLYQMPLIFSQSPGDAGKWNVFRQCAGVVVADFDFGIAPERTERSFQCGLRRKLPVRGECCRGLSCGRPVVIAGPAAIMQLCAQRGTPPVGVFGVRRRKLTQHVTKKYGVCRKTVMQVAHAVGRKNIMKIKM